jgi:hypothetical protein
MTNDDEKPNAMIGITNTTTNATFNAAFLFPHENISLKDANAQSEEKDSESFKTS